ncbi:MAG: Omp28-related outer membrane protein [Saprospiraceae bacterium]
MKKTFLPLVFIFLFSNVIFAQDVPEVQRPLVTKIAATWCPPCGGWGWTFFENLVIDNEEKATMIVAHHDGQLVTAAGTAFSSNFGSPYQPYFYVYNDDVGASSSNVSTKRTEVKDMVDVEAAKSPVANAGMNLSLTGDQLVIDTKTKFFQAASGEYYLGVYAVENGVVKYQAGIGNDAVHEKVLRGSLTGENFGALLMNGDIAVGDEFTNSFTTEYDSWDLDHLEIVTIVWKKDGDKYVAVNTNLSSDFVTVSNVNVLLENASMEILPNVTSTQAVINIDLEKELKNTSIELFDLNGKKVTDIFQGKLPDGNSTFTIERNSVATQGMYFVVLKSDGKVMTKRVVFN